MITVDDHNFEIIENFKDAFNQDDFSKLFTDYFYNYDYIIGDYVGNQLRLKGFYNDNNKKSKNLNKFSKKDDYIKNMCVYNCRYFILKKI